MAAPATGHHEEPAVQTTPSNDLRFGADLAAERGYLLRYARTRLYDGAAAEDAVQDTLLAALQSQGRFEQRATLRTWLTGILINKIADLLRRQQRAGLVAFDETLGQGDASEEGDEAFEPAHGQDPERVLAARQATAALMQGLRRVDALAQHVFVLREIEGLSNGEAASRLGLTPERGAQLLHRTRARLRQGLVQAQVL
jgi:RNA polymerase sigma-70 factor, ECF subfamily